MSQNIFEAASRAKFRFKLPNGSVSTEDLWDLSLPHLDDLGQLLRRDLKAREESEGSLIKQTRPTKADKEIKLKFDIVKHIIDVKLEEKDNAEKSAERKAKRQKLMELIDKKQEQAQGEKSVEELQDELKALEQD